MLHILALRDDPKVDQHLIDALQDPAIRAISAFSLGRIGCKGYPKREREQERILEALGRHLDDTSTFTDPWYREDYRTQDFVVAAFVRVKGPEKFTVDDPDLRDVIGYELPDLTEAQRRKLHEQCKAMAR